MPLFKTNGAVHVKVMPDRSRKPRPKDQNRLGKAIVDEATRERKPEKKPEKDPAAVALGRRGGLKGGKARAESLSANERAAIAKKAAAARWKRDS